MPVRFAAALAALTLFLTGCSHPTEKPAVEETPVAVETPTVTSPPTEVVPEGAIKYQAYEMGVEALASVDLNEYGLKAQGKAVCAAREAAGDSDEEQLAAVVAHLETLLDAFDWTAVDASDFIDLATARYCPQYYNQGIK